MLQIVQSDVIDNVQLEESQQVRVFYLPCDM